MPQAIAVCRDSKWAQLCTHCERGFSVADSTCPQHWPQVAFLPCRHRLDTGRSRGNSRMCRCARPANHLRIPGRRDTATAGAPNFCGSIRMTRQCRGARCAGGQKVATMLNMLAAIPNATILAAHSQQPAATLTAHMGVFFCARSIRQRIGRILFQLRNKSRRSGIRGEDCQFGQLRTNRGGESAA